MSVDEPPDLTDFPEAISAYADSYRLAERIREEAHTKLATGVAARELAKFKQRLELRPVSPEELARLRVAAEIGERDGREENSMRWGWQERKTKPF